jgi:hypothetical protein
MRHLLPLLLAATAGPVSVDPLGRRRDPPAPPRLWTDEERIAAKVDAAQAKREARRIRNLTRAGHTEHCAKRLVWGDGECEPECGRVAG